MLKRGAVVVCLMTLGLMLGGCTKCGFWWDDWRNEPKSCKSDTAP